MFFRRVPAVRDLSSQTSLDNVALLAVHQSKLFKNIGKVTTTKIVSLDRVDSQLSLSLRSILMGLRASHDPGLRLFHSINWARNRDGYVITFLPQLKDEAIAVVATLPTHRRQFVGESTTTWFSSPANRRTRGAQCCERTNRVTAKQDISLEENLCSEMVFQHPRADIGVHSMRRSTTMEGPPRRTVTADVASAVGLVTGIQLQERIFGKQSAGTDSHS